jgi:UMF1 family MFS transporter
MREKLPVGQMIREGTRQLWRTFHELRRHRYLAMFLLAYFFYIDGVNTIIKMSVDYGMSIGLKSESLILAILLVQFVGFPATLGFGWLASRAGPKKSLFICIGVYTFVTVWAFFINAEWEFYALAIMIALVQGGIQSISRAVFGRMIPVGQEAEFFGFYNMLGKFSAVLGPLLVAGVGIMTNDPRFAILSVIVLFVIGAAVLSKVPVAETRES